MAHRGSALSRGQEALARGAWEDARACFQKALDESETAEANEGLSWGAWWLNDFDLLVGAREAAFRLYRNAGDYLGAARMAMWLSSDYADFRGELFIANGWRARAQRLLDGLPIAPEHGWQHLIHGDAAILLENDTVTARQCAAEAIAIARRLAVIDCEIIGVAMEGFAMVSEGEVADGMKLLDEAAAAALAGELEHKASATWVLCYLIYSCERVRDFDRAAEWCRKMRDYADRIQFTLAQGTCRAHYAGVLILRGLWGEAESELAEATEMLRASRPPAVAEGMVRLGELRRRQGRLEEAAEIFRQVEWHPLALFGLAELALDAGKPKDAEELAERMLRKLPEAARYQRADVLELLARARALLGNHRRAAEALAEVQSLSHVAATLPLRAATAFSAGVIALAAGDYEPARACLEDAADLFDKSATPYEAARARLELASVLVSLDRLERARIEAGKAKSALERLGSRFHAGRAAALISDIGRRTAGSRARRDTAAPALTERQVEVLRLISQGKSDRDIAAALGVSEHTVHRHVANILLRLDLPTRAAAAAYSTSRGFI